METSAYFTVQVWIERYDYWSNCIEPTDKMFELPVAHWATEEEGRAKLARCIAGNPAAKFRLIRTVETREVIG